MKLSLNWIKEYTEVKLSDEQLIDVIGSQLGAVEEVVNLSDVYAGSTVVKVVESKPHPQANKLSVCKIDDGRKIADVTRDDRGLVEIVCGAPNVKVGMLAVWLPPNAIVPATFSKDQLKLEPKEIRGVVSNGMLASPKELAIGDNHEGILALTEGSAGQSFADLFGLNDLIIDIENKMFTHRPDLFGELGLAREVAGITHNAFRSPSWYLNTPDDSSENDPGIEIKNTISNLVPRFMVQIIKNVEVKSSSLKVQSYLTRLGVRPINNVVDFTNYFMLLTGQPLHAYDLDKLLKLDSSNSKAVIKVRAPKIGEEIELLNGKTIKLDSEDIVIGSDTKAIGLGGVMGGSETEVDENTKNIVIECANFDMYAIRRTSMRHGLFSDAVTRFNKGQSPLQNDRILAEIVSEIIADCGGESLPKVDNKIELKEPSPIKITSDFISTRLGLKFSDDQISILLTNVEFIVEKTSVGLSITPPFWRTDISIPEDIVEEVGRLFGYSNLKLELPNRTITPPVKNDLVQLKEDIRNIFYGAGGNEVLSYGFVHGNLLDKFGQDKNLAYQLANAISPDLQYLRLSITPSLLELVHPNIKINFSEFALFEINRVSIKNNPHPDEKNLPAEDDRLAFVYAVDDKVAKANYSGAAYYQSRHYLNHLFFILGINYSLVPLSEAKLNADNLIQMAKGYEPNHSALIKVKEQFIGVIGEPTASVRQALKLPNYVSMFEMNIQPLLDKRMQYHYAKLSSYPYIEQDITFELDTKVTYGEFKSFVITYLSENLQNMTFDGKPIDVYQDPTITNRKRITFRIKISSYDKTLTTNEVNALIFKLSEAISRQFHAVLI